VTADLCQRAGEVGRRLGRVSQKQVGLGELQLDEDGGAVREADQLHAGIEHVGELTEDSLGESDLVGVRVTELGRSPPPVR
jgi:hypothetical protein